MQGQEMEANAEMNIWYTDVYGAAAKARYCAYLIEAGGPEQPKDKKALGRNGERDKWMVDVGFSQWKLRIMSLNRPILR